MTKAYFAGGCFWGMEYYFMKLRGVTKTTVGFMGGNLENPSYKQVKTGTTGHLETIEVEFDEAVLPYVSVVRFFFEIHDFEQTDGQGIDIGSQYLSAIFFTDERQRDVAVSVFNELLQMGYKPATQIRPAETFYRAEDYHQKYLEIKGEEPECHVYRPIFRPMGALTLKDKTSKMGMTLPHKIYFNDKLLGIMQKKEVEVKDIPVGKYKLKIQSMFPFIFSEQYIDIKKGQNAVIFCDREKFWDILFTIDLILMVVHWFVHLPDNIDLIYKVVTNGYFILWLVYEFIIRKRYFRICKEQ